MVIDGKVIEQRNCHACGAKEDGSGVVVLAVFGWHGRSLGRWCDWCRELLCWDCGDPRTKCRGTCTDHVAQPANAYTGQFGFSTAS